MSTEDKAILRDIFNKQRIQQNKNKQAFIKWVKEHRTQSPEQPWLVFIDEEFIRSASTYKEAIQGLDRLFYCENMNDIELLTCAFPQ